MRVTFLKAYDIIPDEVERKVDPPSGALYWPQTIKDVIKDIEYIDRYERRARSRRNKTLWQLKGIT